MERRGKKEDMDSKLPKPSELPERRAKVEAQECVGPLFKTGTESCLPHQPRLSSKEVKGKA